MIIDEKILIKKVGNDMMIEGVLSLKRNQCKREKTIMEKSPYIIMVIYRVCDPSKIQHVVWNLPPRDKTNYCRLDLKFRVNYSFIPLILKVISI